MSSNIARKLASSPVVHDTSDDLADDDTATKVGPLSPACIAAMMRAVESASEESSSSGTSSRQMEKPEKEFSSGLRSVAQPMPPRPIPRATPRPIPQPERDEEIEDDEIRMTEVMPATKLRLHKAPMSALAPGWYPTPVVDGSSAGPQSVAREATVTVGPSSHPKSFSGFPLAHLAHPAHRRRGADRQLVIELTCGLGGFLVVLIPALYFLFR